MSLLKSDRHTLMFKWKEGLWIVHYKAIYCTDISSAGDTEENFPSRSCLNQILWIFNFNIKNRNKFVPKFSGNCSQNLFFSVFVTLFFWGVFLSMSSQKNVIFLFYQKNSLSVFIFCSMQQLPFLDVVSSGVTNSSPKWIQSIGLRLKKSCQEAIL